jgi:hypothetical protein
MTRDDGPNWGDQRTIAMWGGAAILLLVAILLYAVSCTADSSKVPETVPVPTSSITPSTYTTSPTSTTSYSVPSVQTSEDSPPGPGVTQPTTQSQ